MAYEQKDGQGVLFKNEDKQEERHADYRGSITINGQQYWLDAWIKTSKGDKKFMSLSAKPKMARHTPGAVAHKEPAFDDEVPF